MKLTEQHRQAINILVSERASGRQLASIAEELGISERTLRRWRMMPAFQQAFEKGIDRWRRDLWSIPLSERKSRLMELQRLYTETPDSYIARVVDTDPPITIYRSNAALKAKLLDQIAEEIGDKRKRDEPDDDPEKFARKVRQLIQMGTDRTGGEAPTNSQEEEEDTA